MSASEVAFADRLMRFAVEADLLAQSAEQHQIHGLAEEIMRAAASARSWAGSIRDEASA